jgi:alpha,alpha-trehalose-phosphate synthase [UDP-forming]
MARRPILVVSNREPYLHSRDEEGRISWSSTPGGVSVALDALMRERGGVWIAHGAGDADRDVVDDADRVEVPPDQPSYSLRRIWLTETEEHRYYNGFANEGLWPLCHVAHIRPVFRTEDWEAYRAVNRRFAEAAAQEAESGTPVFINDYHMALVAEDLEALRPDVRTAIFWHIPWPNTDHLRMCPWRREVLSGLLANDLVAFQLDRDRRNFLTCCRDEFQARVKDGKVHIGGRATRVVTAPIGVDFDRINEMARDKATAAEMERLTRDFALTFPLVGVGVDRLDYTKGIPERLQALDRLMEQRPELARTLTFVQVGVPSRSAIDSYADIEREIDAQVAAINAKHAAHRNDEGPIRYRKIALKTRKLIALYRLARFCIVSSLHDGMNLVAKEFVAAREDGDGVLVLSEMAGAAQELGDAVIINPYDIDGFAARLGEAIDMPEEERRRRMQSMRRIVAGRDVFAWASDILEGLEKDGSRLRRFLPWGRRRS